MVQVCLVGYASTGAFLGLAYFDYYYTLVAVIVICKTLCTEQLAQLDSVMENSREGIAGPSVRAGDDTGFMVKTNS
jgi:hypothetical protein